MDSPTATLTMLNLGPGSLIAQRYEVCERIGSGGMGMVYRVIDHELNDQIVALKLLHPHLAQDDQLFKRFRNEVLIARTLSHPNIVRLHDIGRTEGGFSYISMEFVDGSSLRDRIETTGNGEPKPNFKPLTFGEAVVILYQVLTAVAYAHGKGVVHRDLKPANVLLTRNEEVKLADFGTARIAGMSTSLTQTGQVIGTPDYMSPEQIRGEAFEPACDIYALGIMAYEIVTGRRPFTAESPVALAFKHLSEPISPFAGKENGIPQWYEEMVLRATAKGKGDRFQSVSDFSRLLVERSPDVAAFAGKYPVGASQFVTATQAMPAQKDTFQLGSENARRGDTDSWKLDLSPLREQTESEARSRKPERNEDRSGGGLGLLIGGALVVGLGFFFLRSENPAVAKFRYSLLGAPPQLEPESPATPEQQIAAPPPAEKEIENKADQERRNLEQELLASAGTPVNEGTSTPATTPPPVTVPPISEVKSAPLPPPPPPVIEPPRVAMKPTGGRVTFTQSGGRAVNGPVGASDIVTLSWNAEIDGIVPKDIADRNEFQRKISLNVFDQKKSRVLSKLSPLALDFESQDGVERPHVSGSLSKVAGREFLAGDYRFDLVFDGEVITSAYLSVYSVNQAGSALPIDRGSGGTVVTLPQTEAPPSVENSNAAVVNTPSRPSELPPSAGLPPSQSGRLPAMEGNAIVAPTFPENDLEPLPTQPAVSTQHFDGTVSLPAAGGNETRRLVLDLQISSDDSGAISGSAQIEGFGDFQAQGKVYPRGIEIVLQNTTTAARLTGSRREGDLMRGTISLPSAQVRGTWEARRSPG